MEDGEVIWGDVIDLEAKLDGYLEDGEWGNYFKSDKHPNYQENSQGNNEKYPLEEDDKEQEDELYEEMNEDNADKLNMVITTWMMQKRF